MNPTPRPSLTALEARLGPVRAYMAAASPLAARARPTGRFVIVTSGRTGSELLVSLLRSHPRLSCDGELLEQRRRWPDRLLAGRVARAAAKHNEAYGFKVQPQHILDVQAIAAPHEWLRGLHGQGWQLIHLRRTNRLHQAISVMRATMTQWHYRRGEAGPQQAMTLDPNAVIGTMYLIQHKENQITDMLKGVEHLDLCYEDDLQEPAQQSVTVARICEFLGVAPEPTTTDLARVVPASAREAIANYGEIADVIRANAFVDYLTE